MNPPEQSCQNGCGAPQAKPAGDDLQLIKDAQEALRQFDRLTEIRDRVSVEYGNGGGLIVTVEIGKENDSGDVIVSEKLKLSQDEQALICQAVGDAIGELCDAAAFRFSFAVWHLMFGEVQRVDLN